MVKYNTGDIVSFKSGSGRKIKCEIRPVHEGTEGSRNGRRGNYGLLLLERGDYSKKGAVLNGVLAVDRNLTLISNSKGETMNIIIAELFTTTKDALLVQKHFGTCFNNPLLGILLKDKTKEILSEAKHLEKEEKEEKEEKDSRRA